MYVVECRNGCGTFIETKGNKPILKSCGKKYCAYNQWKVLAEKYNFLDFFDV